MRPPLIVLILLVIGLNCSTVRSASVDDPWAADLDGDESNQLVRENENLQERSYGDEDMENVEDYIMSKSNNLSSTYQDISNELVNAVMDLTERSSNVVNECPYSFIHVHRGCYRPITHLMSWDDAAMFCRAVHPKAHLVFINSVEEQTAVAKLLAGYKQPRCHNGLWWTGGQWINPNTHSPFVWKTTSPKDCSCGPMYEITYSNFRPGQPDNGGLGGQQETCIQLVEYMGHTWNDNVPSSSSCSVCELDM